MRVVIQSFNDVAGVREIGAMVSESVRLRATVRVVVVEHGDARHGSRPRSFWAGLLAQLSTDNVRVRAEIVASTSTPSTRRLHGRVVAAT